MADSTLLHAQILLPGEMAHLTRAVLTGRRPGRLHTHDFCELAWVQNGAVRHHTSSGHTDLAEGDLLFVRPGDGHGWQARGEGAMIVSLTLHPGLVEAIRARHPALAGHFFWAEGAAPARHWLDMRRLAGLNRAALRIEHGRRDALEVEALLIPLLSDLIDRHPPLPEGAPDWLARACRAAAEPQVFRAGAAGFARVAGRAHPHVSRTMRRYLGQSPSDYINAKRMEHAARRLTGSADSLAEIAADCGIPNLSHFHKLFRAHHGATPAQYRRSHQRDVISPG